MTHVPKFVRPHAIRSAGNSARHTEMEAVSEAYCWGDRGAISSICVDNDTWFYAIGEVVQATQEKMLSTPHIGRKRKRRIDQVKIYFVDAKQCQGISELEVSTFALHCKSPCFRLVMKMHLHRWNRKRMNAWLRAELDLNKTIFWSLTPMSVNCLQSLELSCLSFVGRST